MKIDRKWGRAVRIGIAIGGDSLVVRAAPTVLPGGALTLLLAGSPNAEGRWPELDAAFVELCHLLPAGAKVSASVVLAPPLVQLRRIALPPLKADERRRVLCRDASRWFVGAREAFVADALPIAGANGDVMAAAIPARYADAIVRAASSARIELRTVQPAQWAWAASLDRSQRTTTCALVVPGSRAFDVVWLALGAVTGARRLREGADVEARLDALLADGDATTVVRIADPMAVAAEHAGCARGPELLPESVRASRHATVMRRARTIALAAAAMLVVAAGIELWGVQRQLAMVRAERALLRARVTRAMASRDSATSVESQLGVVATEVREAPRWTVVIANLTERLPGDAWLQSLAASGDSVTLVGESAHASEVFEVLRRDPAIAGVRADAPIRREMPADGAPVERLGLTIRLTPAALTTMPESAP